MLDNNWLTETELAEIKHRRLGVRVSLACEGMFLTAEDEALFEEMDRDRLTPDERSARIKEIFSAVIPAKVIAAAE